MYATKLAWTNDITRNRRRIESECPGNWRRRLSRNGSFGNGAANYGWTLYQNARKSPLRMLLLGEQAIRMDRDVLSNFGTTANRPGRTPGGLRISNTTSGSVLNDANWWPFLNDAWLIGGMHGIRTFYLAGEPPDDALWDDRNGRPRMLGRELFLLLSFGYELEDTSLGWVLKPIRYDLIYKVSLSDFHTAVDGVRGKEDIGAKIIGI